MEIIKKIGLKCNISLAIFSKISGLVASFVMIPILLNSLGVEKYGLWVTLSSVAAWLLFFDFGLGNSFKNIVAIGNQKEIIKEYSLVCSLFFYVSLALLFCFIIFLLLNKEALQNQKALIFLYLPLCVLFPLRLFSFGLQGLRLVGINTAVETLRIFIWLIFSVFYVYFNDGERLYVLSIIFVSANIIPQFIQFIIFKGKCGFSLSPHFITPTSIFIEDSFKLGIRFFIIQMSSLVSFNLGNMLVYSYFGAADVAMYDVYNKVFVAALSVFNMSLAVIWPEITKAYADNNINKCNKLYKSLLLISSCFSICVFIVALKFDLLLQLLNIDGILTVDAKLLWSVVVLTCLQSIAYCGAVVLNATNKLKLQIFLALASIIFIYPLFKLMVSIELGLASYPIATCIMVLFGAILYNLSSFRLLNPVSRTRGKL